VAREAMPQSGLMRLVRAFAAERIQACGSRRQRQVAY
jgi:hypothetical protein